MIFLKMLKVLLADNALLVYKLCSSLAKAWLARFSCSVSSWLHGLLLAAFSSFSTPALLELGSRTLFPMPWCCLCHACLKSSFLLVLSCGVQLNVFRFLSFFVWLLVCFFVDLLALLC